MGQFKLLIVEDDRDFANALFTALSKESVVLTLAVNHSAAIRLIEKNNTTYGSNWPTN